MKQFVIIVAGGKGLRMGSETPKQFLPLKGKAIVLHTLEKFKRALPKAELVLVLPKDEIQRWEELSTNTVFDSVKIAHGGANRFESVKSGLALLEGDGLVAVHDSVRPLVSSETIHSVFEKAEKKGNAIPVVGLKDSIRRIENGHSIAENREEFRLIQTPQCFKMGVLKSAYKQEFRVTFTDDASVVEALGEQINLVEGNSENIKITTLDDLKIAAALI